MRPWKCFLVLGYKGLCVHTNTKRRTPLKCQAMCHFTINYLIKNSHTTLVSPQIICDTSPHY